MQPLEDGTVQMWQPTPTGANGPIPIHKYTPHRIRRRVAAPVASVDRFVCIVAAPPATDSDSRGAASSPQGSITEQQAAKLKRSPAGMAGTCIARMRARSPHCVCAVVDRRSSSRPFPSNKPRSSTTHPSPTPPTQTLQQRRPAGGSCGRNRSCGSRPGLIRSSR